MRISVPVIGAVVAVLLAVAFFFLLYQPRVQERTALQAETTQLEGQQLTFQAEIARLEAIRDDQPRIERELAAIAELIPGAIEQPAVIDELQAIAATAGVGIRSVTFADPVPANPPAAAADGRQLATIAVNMTLEGGYFQAVDFLRRMETEAARANLVQSVSIAEGEGQFPSLATTVTGNLFALLPPGAGLPPVAEVAPAPAPEGDAVAPPPEAP